MLTHSLFFLGAERRICSASKETLCGSMLAFTPALKNLPLATFFTLSSNLNNITFPTKFFFEATTSHESTDRNCLANFAFGRYKGNCGRKSDVFFLQKKIEPKARQFPLWRRERDLNPRYLAVYRFSRPAHSTTLTSLQSTKIIHYILLNYKRI